VLLGSHDELVSADERVWVSENVKDVRWLDTDHFILFRQPEAITEVVVEALENRSTRTAVAGEPHVCTVIDSHTARTVLGHDR
jgi:surfactin synthase thioesterase subunit